MSAMAFGHLYRCFLKKNKENKSQWTDHKQSMDATWRGVGADFASLLIIASQKG